MKKCTGSDPVWGLSAYLTNRSVNDSELISCQDWKIGHMEGKSKKSLKNYRVKILQSQNDLFYP